MASKRHLRRRSCQSKVGYPTKEAAVWNAGRLRRANDGGTWVAYRCEFCGQYHVGRQRAGDRRQMRLRRAGEAS